MKEAYGDKLLFNYFSLTSLLEPVHVVVGEGGRGGMEDT